jgi:putative flavoprotein involved in K+ transport
VEGLYFLGLPWLNTWGSGRFLGVAEDAQHLVEVIAQRQAARAPAPAPRLAETA